MGYSQMDQTYRWGCRQSFRGEFVTGEVLWSLTGAI